MATDFSKLKSILDLPLWRPLAPLKNIHVAGGALVGDPRGNGDADPWLYQLASATVVNRVHPARLGASVALASPSLANTFGAGACAVVHPTQGPRGIVSTGNTTTKVVLSTALPAAVGINQLANRGDGQGYIIRIVGNANGSSSGKVEERRIVANTAGATPTIWLDSTLTFTPASGDAYEILAGRVFLLNAGAPAAGQFKYYDVATNSYSGNLATANLPTVTTDNAMLAMSESNVPSTATSARLGFYGALTATATATGTLTGHASGGDSGATANQWRNFQIRIIQDTTTPAAAGQRRRITSHTAGASPIYTLASNWTVTPSSNAQYVIEYDDDKVLMWGSGNASTYTYSIAANAWDTTTFGAAGGNHAAGVMALGMWGITPDAGVNAKPSMIVVPRGGSVATIDVLDIAGGTNGSWDNAAVFGGGVPAFTTGACGAYEANTNGGRYAYINFTGQYIDRVDLLTRQYEPYSYLPATQGVFVAGSRMANCLYLDGQKMNFLHVVSNAQSLLWQLETFV